MTTMDASLFDALYSAPFDQARWVDVLGMLADGVGGSSGWISRLDIVTGLGQGLTSRLDPEWVDAYGSYYHRLNPFVKALAPGAASKTWRPGVFNESSIVPVEDLQSSEYFNEFMKPQAVEATLIVRLSLSDNISTAVNLNRSRQKPEFTSADLTFVREVEPHLQRALALSRKFASLSALQADLATAMYDVPAVTFLLDLNGRLLSTNRRGEAYLAKGGPLTVEGGQLTAEKAAEADLLRAAIARAAAPESEIRRGGSVVLTTTGPRPAVVDVTPIRMENGGFFVPPPSVLVTVTAAAEPSENYQHFAQTYHLTAAETRVAAAIVSGLRLQEIADRTQLSRNTIRVHLAKVFEKTRVSRQADLVRLMIGRSAG